MSGDFVLPFGKYNGYALKDVPLAYVKWLCCFEHVWRDGMVVTQELSIPSPRQKYVLSKQWPTMMHARHFAEDARMCFECFHVMADGGTGGIYAAWCDDPETYHFHKYCWLRIGEENSCGALS